MRLRVTSPSGVMTVTSPSSTRYTFSTGVASSKAPPPGRKCERPIQKLRVLLTSKPWRRRPKHSWCLGASYVGAADVLEADHAVAEDQAVAGLPVGKVILDGVAFELLVLLDHAGKKWAGAVHADGGGQRVVQSLLVDADALGALLEEVLDGARHETRRVGEVLLRIAVVLVPAAVDDHKVAGLDLGRGLLEVLSRDRRPVLSLGHREDDRRAKVLVQRHLVGVLGAFDDVRRSVGVRRAVHHGGDLLAEHARLGVVVHTLDLHILEVRPQRCVVAEGSAQIVELEAGPRIIRLVIHCSSTGSTIGR